MTIDDYAKQILEYMRLDMDLKPSSAILGLGSLETRVADRAAQLILDGYSDLLIFSGGYGKITKGKNARTEAETFKEIAVNKGVVSDNILLETRSTNTGENIQFTEQLLLDKGVKANSLIVVTKPYMERRVYAAFKKQWSNPNIEIMVTSPQISYEEHFNKNIPKELFINVMVGDLQRIKVFPKMGFQVEQQIPDEVWDAFKALVALGYDKHIVKDTSV